MPRQPDRRRVTSREVALEAGVSRTTVSFVLNDRSDVAIPEVTRRRVWAAARRLGYAPSPEARALRLGRSAVVLCLLPDWPISGPIGVMLESLSSQLAVSSLTMLTYQRQPGDQLHQVLAAITPTAIVALCDLEEAEIEFAAQRGIEVMPFMARAGRRANIASFMQADIGRLQVRTVVDRGHHCLAYVSPSDRKLDWFSAPRLDGARREARRLGARLFHFRLPANPDERIGDWLETSRAKGVTAACAYNDEVAFSLMMSAADRGLVVPHDLSLIGVDDLAFARLTRPALSTIGFDLQGEAGRITSLITGDGEGAQAGSSSQVLEVKVRDSLATRDQPR